MDPRRAFGPATALPYWRAACLLTVLGAASPAAGQSLLRWVLDQKVIETTAMVADYPRLGGLTAAERQQHVEFVTGNTLFVLGHEAGHALISEMGIAVLGREEDAADVFSALVALQIGNAFADRVLINRDLADPAMVAIVVAHELGHVFGLVHVSPAARLSLMNPGNLVTPPTDADQQTIEALWGRCR